ncbi:MAG: glycosyltransferase N-terminal domain-containing protein [bacterium]
MKAIWILIYNIIVLPIFWSLLRILSIFNPKIRKGLEVRKSLFEDLRKNAANLGKAARVWVHVSSLGEFEQAKPIITALKQRHPKVDIIVSFFSPSGYEHSKNIKTVSLITYLPFDSVSNARQFLDVLSPSVAIMIRYDLWPNHIWELERRKIPILIANGAMRANSSRLLPVIRNFHHYLYAPVKAILTVSASDYAAYKQLNLPNTEVETIGETRYDQVVRRREEARTKHLIPESLLNQKEVFIVGSSWEEDETILIPAYSRLANKDPHAIMILVPHEPTLSTLERLETTLEAHQLRSIRFSCLNDYSNENVILVDSIGILMGLYQYGIVAYVGGSFKQGIHNVLEPAVYGIPLLYGPKHENSHEAKILLQRGGASLVTSVEECSRQLERLFSDAESRKRAGQECLQLVEQSVGATEKFIAKLAHYVTL